MLTPGTYSAARAGRLARRAQRWAASQAGLALPARAQPAPAESLPPCCSHVNLPVMLRALRAHLAACTLLAGVVAPGVLGRDTGACPCRTCVRCEASCGA